HRQRCFRLGYGYQAWIRQAIRFYREHSLIEHRRFAQVTSCKTSRLCNRLSGSLSHCHSTPVPQLRKIRSKDQKLRSRLRSSPPCVKPPPTRSSLPATRLGLPRSTLSMPIVRQDLFPTFV